MTRIERHLLVSAIWAVWVAGLVAIPWGGAYLGLWGVGAIADAFGVTVGWAVLVACMAAAVRWWPWIALPWRWWLSLGSQAIDLARRDKPPAP